MLRLTDGSGLYLFINQAGKYWRMDYRMHGTIRKTLSIGVYPAVTLKQARLARDAARADIQNGIDPSQKKVSCSGSTRFSFEHIANEWHEKYCERWTERHAKKVMERMTRHLFPALGKVPITKIDAALILPVLRVIESKGVYETTHRCKQIAGQVFRYAISCGYVSHNPTADLAGALKPINTKHFSTLVDPQQVGGLLRAIDEYQGYAVTRYALAMLPYLLLRPGNLRSAEWTEFNLDKGEWRIPKEKMKMRDPHIVPLTSHVVGLIEDLRLVSGNSRYLFPSVRSLDRPLCENTLNSALRRMGYTKEEICSHGFRAMASTILNEHNWPSKIIELQLSHLERNKVKAAYDHAKHLPLRRLMMQAWTDFLNEVKINPEQASKNLEYRLQQD